LDIAVFNGRLIARNEVYAPVTLIGAYVNMTTKIKVSCRVGHEWLTKPQDILAGHGCNICSRVSRVYPTQLHIPQEILLLLNDKDWLYDQHVTNQLTMEKISNNIGVTPKCISSYIRKHNIQPCRFGNSQIERDLLMFLRSVTSTDIICNDRSIIAPLELDFYIPEFKLGIEVNGVYWHSELNGRAQEYHLTKTTQCNDRGIQLIQIWDTEWNYKQDIVKSRINNLLKNNKVIYARSCVISIVSVKDARQFICDNHIQGYVNSPIRVGLYYDVELIGMMTFGVPRFNNDVQYELLRFVTKQGTSIVGGASKLHNWFVSVYSPYSIISYCDLRYGTGKLYNILQYKHVRTSLPNQYYFKRNNSKTQIEG
jgi:very-short-patch-repair endonuclease